MSQFVQTRITIVDCVANSCFLVKMEIVIECFYSFVVAVSAWSEFGMVKRGPELFPFEPFSFISDKSGTSELLLFYHPEKKGTFRNQCQSLINSQKL